MRKKKEEMTRSFFFLMTDYTEGGGKGAKLINPQ